MNNREGMISMLTDDGSMVDFFVLEETRIGGKNYLLVTDSPEDEDGECYILKDISRPEDSEAVYEFVEEDGELEFLYRIFNELVSDMDIDLMP